MSKPSPDFVDPYEDYEPSTWHIVGPVALATVGFAAAVASIFVAIQGEGLLYLSFALITLACAIPVAWFFLHERRNQHKMLPYLNPYWGVVWAVFAGLIIVALLVSPAVRGLFDSEGSTSEPVEETSYQRETLQPPSPNPSMEPSAVPEPPAQDQMPVEPPVEQQPPVEQPPADIPPAPALPGPGEGIYQYDGSVSDPGVW